MKLIKGFGHGAFLWDKDMSYFDEVVDIISGKEVSSY